MREQTGKLMMISKYDIDKLLELQGRMDAHIREMRINTGSWLGYRGEPVLIGSKVDGNYTVQVFNKKLQRQSVSISELYPILDAQVTDYLLSFCNYRQGDVVEYGGRCWVIQGIQSTSIGNATSYERMGPQDLGITWHIRADDGKPNADNYGVPDKELRKANILDVIMNKL
jgi:hypothetical protein